MFFGQFRRAGLLKSFVLTIGELNYHADIDPDDHTARIGEIQYGGQISGVDYRLAEGATIAPDPKSLVGEWPESQEFAVSKEGRSENYTVYLSAYVANGPKLRMKLFSTMISTRQTGWITIVGHMFRMVRQPGRFICRAVRIRLMSRMAS